MPQYRGAAATRVLRLLAVVGFGLLALLSGGQPHARAAAETLTITAPSNTTIPECDDYATQVLGQPWDMSNPDTQTFYLYHMTRPIVANGIWSAQTTDPYAEIFLQYQGWPDSADYLAERSGNIFPIDSRRFSHLRFRMYSSVADRVIAWWYTSRAWTPGGNSDFVTTQPGWHTYDIDLTTTVGGHGSTWSTANWNGLRLDPVFGLGHTGATIQLDWVRLTPATCPATTVTWTAGNANSDPVNLYLDTDQNAHNGNELPIATNLLAGSGRYTWNTAGLAPGTYYIEAVMGAVTSYSGPLVVNAAPVLNLTAPSATSGEDYATTVLGAPWTLSSLTQLQQSFNLFNPAFGPGYMQASSNNDPQMWFLNGDMRHAIDTSKYHYFSYNLYLAAPNAPPTNGQYSQWNAGPRVIWSRTARPLNWQQTQAIIGWYDHWLRPTYDLRTIPLIPGSNEGWTGSPSIFRVDPHEEDGLSGSHIYPAFFRMGAVRLTADPTVAAGGQTAITWAASKATGSVTLSYSSSPGGATRAIATVPLSAGGYVWTVNRVAPGRYWIVAQVGDGLNTFGQVSQAPLVVTGSAACPAAYADVPAAYPFYPFISSLSCRNVVTGDSQNRFQPDAPATRGTVAQWVVLAQGWPLVSAGPAHFWDVPRSDPLFPYVETAYQHGVLSGYGDGSFHPYELVTRGQMSKMIVNALGWPINTHNGPHFSDVGSLNAFYGQVETIDNLGIVSGYADGTFRWQQTLTRGQLAKVIANALAH